MTTATLLVLCIAIVAALAAKARPSWAQRGDQITIREPDSRQLGVPHDARLYARQCLDYARLSLLVYRWCDFRRSSPEDKRRATRRFNQCEEALIASGWKPWDKFLERSDYRSDEARHALARANLYVEVWAREDPPEVVVAFTGTYFTSLRDWINNLRWFLVPLRYIPGYADQYLAVARTVGHARLWQSSSIFVR